MQAGIERNNLNLIEIAALAHSSREVGRNIEGFVECCRIVIADLDSQTLCSVVGLASKNGGCDYRQDSA
jgi:hypothetical protein